MPPATATLVERLWENNRIVTKRFRADDGQPLPETLLTLKGSYNPEIHQWQNRGRFAVFAARVLGEHPLITKLRDRYNSLGNRIGWPWNSEIHSHGTIVLYDQVAGRPIAHIAKSSETLFELLDEHTLVVVDRSGLEYYSVPPRRNWKWLLGPALAPFGLWFAFRWFRQ